MNTRRRIKPGLSDKISLTVIAIGVLGLILVYYTSIYYRNIAYEHYQRTIQILAAIEIEEIVDDLKSDAADLAQALEQQPGFLQHIADKNTQALVQQLDNQFYQYFVTANIIDLSKLYVFDVDFEHIAASSEGINTGTSTQLICPAFSQNANSRRGADRLQLVSGTCNHDERPQFVLISSLGGLKPIGYIQIVADLTSKLQHLELALGMPVQFQLKNGEISYQSDEWAEVLGDKNHLPVEYMLGTYNNEDSVRIFFMADMTQFNQRVMSHRNWVMALATMVVAATVILILYILQGSTITPLSRIHKILDRLSQYGVTQQKETRVLFAQLLENIITLQKNRKQRFATMILDLDNFEAVNQQLGHDAGTELLQHVGDRLAATLRGSDIVSWTGTDSPGHKLMPVGTKTEYRATLARLGGDEFGVLLPTVETEQQANSVARRIINSLDSDYKLNNQQVTLKCCIGISIYPDHGQEAEELIRNADKAMFKARQSAGKYCIYSAKQL
jgi:GGDEF domain-containing protein